MIIINIPTDRLAAVATAMSKKDPRYYLCGVHVTSTRNKNAVAIEATDGHRFMRALLDQSDGETDCDYSNIDAIVPADAVQQILKAAGRKQPTIQLKIDGENFELIVPMGVAIRGKLIDGTYPETQGIWPAETSNEPAQYNAAYLADMSKAAKLLGEKSGYFHVHHNGRHPSLISFDEIESVVGIVMPIRFDPSHTPSAASYY